MLGRLCLRLGVSLPFLQKSKAPHNKVDELARGWVSYEIKVCTCYPATLALPDGPQKAPSKDQCSWSRLWHPVSVTQTSAFGNVRIQGTHQHEIQAQLLKSFRHFHREKKRMHSFWWKVFTAGKHLMNCHSYNVSDATLITASCGLHQLTVMHPAYYNMHTRIGKVGK